MVTIVKMKGIFIPLVIVLIVLAGITLLEFFVLRWLGLQSSTRNDTQCNGEQLLGPSSRAERYDLCRRTRAVTHRPRYW